MKNFYTVIIGSELLNGRRKDSHFKFVNSELLKRGFEQKASFVIKDEPEFIEDVFKFIRDDENSVMFSFGGIGTTPDDYTREASANVFSNSKMEINLKAKALLETRIKKEDMYPYAINMANLPVNAKLLKNVINNVAGYYLEDRFFFVPGFPNMAYPMIIQALDNHYPNNAQKFRKTLTADCSENQLIPIMEKLPSDIDFSSLPQMSGDKKNVVISIASYDLNITKKYFQLFEDELNRLKINYQIGDSL